MKLAKMSDRARQLERLYPNIDRGNARFLHLTRNSHRRKHHVISVYTIMWSEDARVTLHRTDFTKKYRLSVPEWAAWIRSHVPEILKNQVLNYMNRTHDSIWHIDRIFGWHFRDGGPE